MNPVARRSFLSGVGLSVGVAGGAWAESLTHFAPQYHQAVTASAAFDVRDYGTNVGGGGDDTAAFNAALTAAAAAGGDVFVPPGTYRAEGLVIPDFVIVRGPGQNARFSATTVNGGARAAVRIIRPGAVPSTSTNTMVTISGSGAGLRDIQIEGSGAPGTIVVTNGFETVLQNVRIISGTGIGLDVEKANNVKWGWVYIDNCGSASLPAMRVWSKSGAGIPNETNNFDIYSLRIERSRGTALQLGVGPTSDQFWVEWMRIFTLHIENPKNANEDFSTANPLVKIGNVRSLEVFGYMLYGGSGPIVRHNQVATRGFGNGGIRFIGGTMLGIDPSTGTSTAAAVDLVAGTDFKVIGGRFHRFGVQVVAAQPAYGKYQIDDADSDVKIQPAPTAAAPGATALSVLGTDTQGHVFWTTGPSPTSGTQVQVTFYHGASDAAVMLMPKNAATAAMGLYAAIASDNLSFTIRASNAPAATTAMQVDYLVRRM